ncbi:MAG: anaerobic ribonucleoside-triphosphate reductase, partial [Candidatus Micrarchaeota archaeon]
KQACIDKDVLNRNIRKNKITRALLRNTLEKVANLQIATGNQTQLLENALFYRLRALVEGHLYFDEITSIKQLPVPEYVYDISVEGKENFLGGTGLIALHNTSYRLARIDKKKTPEIVVANNDAVKKGAEPFYTNSTHLPVNYTDDVFEAVELQDDLQCKYTGGTVLHCFLGERIHDHRNAGELVKKVFATHKLPYMSLTPTFSICNRHGYVEGEKFYCPKCDAEIGWNAAAATAELEAKRNRCEVYSRIVGYLRPVQQWNAGKQAEYKMRVPYNKQLDRPLAK